MILHSSIFKVKGLIERISADFGFM
jgi:hypothetical protein